MSNDVHQRGPQNRQLLLGTISFTVCFAAWGLISAFAPRFRQLLHLTATQTAFLVGVPVLLGALDVKRRGPDNGPSKYAI